MRGIEAVLSNKKKSPITGISPNSLTVSDFSRSLDFFRKGLGLMLKKQVGQNAEFDVAGSIFALSGGEAEGSDRLTVTTKDLAKVRESLGAWGTSLDGEPEEREYRGQRALVGSTSDPEGNIVELVQYV